MRQFDQYQFNGPIGQQSYRKLEVIDTTSGIGVTVAESADYNQLFADLMSQSAEAGCLKKTEPDSYHILMIEDNHLTQWAAQKRFKKLGCQVSIVSTLKLGQILAKTRHYDLILLDITLPDGDGRDVARSIYYDESSPNHHTPIVGLTAHLNSVDEESCIAAGMAQKLTKPLTQEKINMIFERYVKNNAPTTSREEKLTAKVVLILNLAMRAKSISGERITSGGLLKQWVRGLFEECEQLQLAWNMKQWRQLKASVRRLHSSAGYYKMSHLQACCAALESALTDSDAMVSERISALYRQLLQEIEMVLEEHPA